jgi:phospholipid/cholesterol/gamma-HCH transport system permease protein
MTAAVLGGAALVELQWLQGDLTTAAYFEGVRESVRGVPAASPLAKSVLSGFLLALTAYHFGSREKASTRAIGAGVTQTVVFSSLLVILADFLVSCVF